MLESRSLRRLLGWNYSGSLRSEKESPRVYRIMELSQGIKNFMPLKSKRENKLCFIGSVTFLLPGLSAVDRSFGRSVCH